VEHVIAAGISPVGIPIFFERLLEERRARPGALEGWFASHPLEEDRIVAVRRQIDEIDPRQLEGLLVDTPHYQAFRARVRALPPSQPPRRIVPPE
jgi:predicted Zn-dependent protease